MFKSSIGHRIPLSSSSSTSASSSKIESEDAVVAAPPPPPPRPPPPLLDTGNINYRDGAIKPASLPLPPPPLMPPKPVAANLVMPLPAPPLLPPPPGPPPKEQNANHLPPPPLQLSAQPPPPGVSGGEKEINQPALLDGLTSKEQAGVYHASSSPSPPKLGLPMKSSNQTEGASSDADTNNFSATKDLSKLVPPPPPPRQQPPVPGPLTTLQPDVLPPGISSHPPTTTSSRYAASISWSWTCRPCRTPWSYASANAKVVWSSRASPNDETTTSTGSSTYLPRR